MNCLPLDQLQVFDSASGDDELSARWSRCPNGALSARGRAGAHGKAREDGTRLKGNAGWAVGVAKC
jgi:hypothetical protein